MKYIFDVKTDDTMLSIHDRAIAAQRLLQNRYEFANKQLEDICREQEGNKEKMLNRFEERLLEMGTIKKPLSEENKELQINEDLQLFISDIEADCGCMACTLRKAIKK